jgi:hypothetical protein
MKDFHGMKCTQFISNSRLNVDNNTVCVDLLLQHCCNIALIFCLNPLADKITVTYLIMHKYKPITDRKPVFMQQKLEEDRRKCYMLNELIYPSHKTSVKMNQLVLNKLHCFHGQQSAVSEYEHNDSIFLW